MANQTSSQHHVGSSSSACPSTNKPSYALFSLLELHTLTSRSSSRCRSTSRGGCGHRNKCRSRSLPPLRRSPRIAHTQGRLHEDYSETQKKAQLATAAAVAVAVNRMLSTKSLWCAAPVGAVGRSRTQPRKDPAMTSYGGNGSRRRVECIRIEYYDESLRQKQESKLAQLLDCAKNDPQTSTRAILAKKALRYRRVLSPDQLSNLNGAIVEKAAAAKCNRIKWCKLQTPVNQQPRVG